jgi:hypothetical protein
MQGNSMIPTDRKFDEHVLTRICQECGALLDSNDLEAEKKHEDCMCRDCRAVRLEIDLDNAWSVYLLSLKPHAAQLVEQVDNQLRHWQFSGGGMTFEQDAKGRRSVATAKDFRFVAPGHKVEAVFGLEGVTLRNTNPHHASPEWSVLFSFETPLPVILAACVAGSRYHRIA